MSLFDRFHIFLLKNLVVRFIYADLYLLKTNNQFNKNERLHERTTKNCLCRSNWSRNPKEKINRLHKKGHQRLLNWIHKFRPTFKYIDMQTLQTHTRTQLFTSLLTNKIPLTVNSLFAICADCWRILYMVAIIGHERAYELNSWFVSDCPD